MKKMPLVSGQIYDNLS